MLRGINEHWVIIQYSHYNWKRTLLSIVAFNIQYSTTSFILLYFGVHLCMYVLYTGVVGQVCTIEIHKRLSWVTFVLSSILALHTLLFDMWPHAELGALYVT